MGNPTVAAAEIALVGDLTTQWAERTPIHWPETPTDIPADAEQWLDVDILWGDGEVFTMGEAGVGKNRVAGVVQFTVNGPRDGSGRGALLVVAAAAMAVFNRREVPPLRFGAPSGPMPGNPNGAWLSVIVRVPFEYEETF